MSNTDTSRIHHEIDDLPTTYRYFGLEQILNDISELLSGKGDVQIIKLGAFVSQIIVWEDNSRTRKRSETTLDRSASPPFVNTITEDVYTQDGASIVATITSQLTRDANKSVVGIDTTVTRP